MLGRWFGRPGVPTRVVNLGSRGYPEFVRVVAIQSLQERRGEHVGLAASGETVLVTHRDVVIAELGPPRPFARPEDAGPLSDLARGGLVHPATNARGLVPPSKPIMPTERVLSDLREDRDGR